MQLNRHRKIVMNAPWLGITDRTTMSFTEKNAIEFRKKVNSRLKVVEPAIMEEENESGSGSGS